MQQRQQRLHGLEGIRSLAEMPLDGGGVKKVEVLGARLATPGVRASVHRPTLDGGAKPPSPSLALASVPEPTLATGSDAVAPSVRFEFDGTTVRAQVALGACALYGGGEAAGRLRRDGRALELWNTDAWRYGEATPALYQSHPFALALRGDGSAVGVLADSIRRGRIVFATDGVELAFDEEPFDVWILEADGPAAIVQALSELTGRIEVPPLWALGYHQSRWGYASADEVREIATKMRARGIPCDAIWLDIDHMDRFRSFTWDRDRFRDPVALCDELREQGFQVVSILDPGLAADKTNKVFEQARKGDHLVLDRGGMKPVRGRVWPGTCAFPDFSREETRAWWASLVEGFVESGVAGLWVDMNEPSVMRTPERTLPPDALHRGSGRGSHARFHNLYGQWMAEATRQGLLDARPTERPFVLTRAGHLMTQRFAATWTGDNQATWDDLRWSIPMVLSLGLCGQPFSGPDVGGFDGDPTPELFARWFELAAYLPFCRGHSEKHACRKEPWSFGAETERHVKAALQRRMALVPTLSSLFHEASLTGLPIARPMFFADPSDPALRDLDDQFLLGEDLLVAPVVEQGATKRTVVLPRSPTGGWYLFPAGGEMFPPGRYAVDAPLGTTPVFARAGRIVVTKPSRPHTGAQADDEHELHVFLDARQRASGWFHEDDGRSRPAKGSRIELAARVMRGRVVVDAFCDGKELVDRVFRIHAHGLAPVRA